MLNYYNLRHLKSDYDIKYMGRKMESSNSESDADYYDRNAYNGYNFEQLSPYYAPRHYCNIPDHVYHHHHHKPKSHRHAHHHHHHHHRKDSKSEKKSASPGYVISPPRYSKAAHKLKEVNPNISLSNNSLYIYQQQQQQDQLDQLYLQQKQAYKLQKMRINSENELNKNVSFNYNDLYAQQNEQMINYELNQAAAANSAYLQQGNYVQLPSKQATSVKQMAYAGFNPKMSKTDSLPAYYTPNAKSYAVVGDNRNGSVEFSNENMMSNVNQILASKNMMRANPDYQQLQMLQQQQAWVILFFYFIKITISFKNLGV